MNHNHTGPEDTACNGCLDEANEIYRKTERRKTVAGLLLLIALVLVGMGALSWYLSQHGSHLR